MTRGDNQQKLQDALDLLSMLEHVTGSFPGDRTTDIPWRGVRLTLAQVKDIIAGLVRQGMQVTREEVFSAPLIPVAPTANPIANPAAGLAKTVAPTVAQRIQRAPTGTAHVRQLGGSTRIEPKNSLEQSSGSPTNVGGPTTV